MRSAAGARAAWDDISGNRGERERRNEELAAENTRIRDQILGRCGETLSRAFIRANSGLACRRSLTSAAAELSCATRAVAA